MRNSNFRKIFIPAFLLAAAVAGCGDGDKNAGTGNPGDPLTPPTVTLVTPPDGSTLVCTAVITATFSKDMNPATINSPATTFTLTGPSGSVAGTVNYVVATRIATFTPSTLPLGPPNASFTATVSTAAKDNFGNALAANKVWTFTVSPPCTAPGGLALGAACGYGVLAGATVTNTGPTHIVNGDLGLSPGSSVTGFADPPANTYVGTGTHTAGLGLVSGIIHITDAPPSPNDAKTAQTNLTTAYNDLAGRTAPAPTTVAGDLGGLTLAPGLYKSTSTLGITGTLTLDGQGNANAVWIFQIASSLTTLSGSNVKLTNSASAHNIFWQVGSSATLGTTSTFNGSILSLASITLATGATLNGRALAQTAGAVTLDSNMVTVPACP
jgi:Ice-binding-like/Bacterial Ig-like domain